MGLSSPSTRGTKARTANNMSALDHTRSPEKTFYEARFEACACISERFRLVDHVRHHACYGKRQPSILLAEVRGRRHESFLCYTVHLTPCRSNWPKASLASFDRFGAPLRQSCPRAEIGRRDL